MYTSQDHHRPKEEIMDELLKMAKGHYQASPDKIQDLAHHFFDAMDSDGDGKINLREFQDFMREEGYAQMTNPRFFEKLDLHRKGTLDFWEVMALYYIVKSGRPFCDHCGNFIPGTYVTCVACLENPKLNGTVHLCLDCYLAQVCGHTHDGVSQFMDNYSLLEAKIRSKPTSDQSRSLEAKSPPSMAIVPSTSSSVPPSTSTTPSTVGAIVPYPPTAYTAVTPIVHTNTYWIHNVNTYTHIPHIPERQKWKIALGALDAAITLGAIGVTLGSCTIL